MTMSMIAEGFVGTTPSIIAGRLNETTGGWLTGATAPTQLLPAAGHTADPALLSALYQQATVQHVCCDFYIYHIINLYSPVINDIGYIHTSRTLKSSIM